MSGGTALSRETRARLVEAATRAFAADGVRNASLLDITRRAGQRNRGAVHYHFGSRTGLLIAVLEQHADFLGVRERDLLERARARPDDLQAAAEAVVRPVTELAATGWSRRCFLVIVADLIAEEETAALAGVGDVLVRAGAIEVYDLLSERLAHLPAAIREERLVLLSSFVLRSVADRARALDAEEQHLGVQRRPQLDEEEFVTHLVGLVVAMLQAPGPDDGTAPAPGTRPGA